jgi:hypothetical protein
MRVAPLPDVPRPGARKLTALVLVPTLLVLADITADRTALKFLLLPPLGALTYLVFVNPAHVEMNFRRIVICPTLTALLAWIIAGTLGYSFVSVALVTIGTMAVMWGLGAASIVPPLALALLTILLHEEVRGQVDYLLSVLIYSCVLYVIYRLWLRLPIDSHTVD